MNDTTRCFLCYSQLKSLKNCYNKQYKKYWLKRYCQANINHTCVFYTDSISKKIISLTITVLHNSKQSMIAEFDFKDNNTTIKMLENNKEINKIEIPKIIEPDFPKLEEFKEKIRSYVLFS